MEEVKKRNSNCLERIEKNRFDFKGSIADIKLEKR